MSTTPLLRATIDYPSSDGKPMAENGWQRAAMLYALGALCTHFAERPKVYVSGDLLIYHEEGNPRARVAPDVFVVFGAEARVAALEALLDGERDGERGWRNGGGVIPATRVDPSATGVRQRASRRPGSPLRARDRRG